MPSRPRRPRDQIVGKLRAADPFELIRWLARSQPDPRKALAELVQNSLDAGARRVEITRLRERGVSVLSVVDDGEGVIADLPREEALAYVATHIGHSRKRNLTPHERRELMLQGQYGIGLLGFWAIGTVLEMRSTVPGQPATLLRLHEDSPTYEIERVRGRLPIDGPATEVVIYGLHRGAALSLTARRIADYLGGELRGQLLARKVTLLVRDRIARGRAPKVVEVTPRRFEGQRLELPEQVPVPGFAPLRLELYLLPEGEVAAARVAVSCGGTVVADDIADLDGADFRRAPWSAPRLTGLIEFPDFAVPPGSRRGVLPDQAAVAFAAALTTLETALQARLDEVGARAAAALDADVLRQLERAFRDLSRLAPEYDFFAVRAAEESPAAALAGAVPPLGEDGAPAPGVPMDTPLVREAASEAEVAELLPAGALAAAEIVPAATRVERFGMRGLRVVARDAAGVRIRRPLHVAWSGGGELGRLDPATGMETTFHAGEAVGTATLSAEVREAQRGCTAVATVRIVEASPADEARRAGIPEPVFVDEPNATWRSRMPDGRWEVNSGHPNYRVAAESARRRLRYLAALLAKEVVLHSFPQPQLGPALERLIEVLTITERRLER